ncbi:MAG: acylneuraminate cytidylyltransferase family protein [Actinomycetota bacterium]|nr:acylneuraminate cytidylyltransferase family protein [Actinomycetota bacterium]
MKILAIIPARGGSKGIKNKNIVDLNGHPLIAYSIAAAKSFNKIDRILCTTDSKKIAKIAEAYGAWVPFLRPPELARDDTPDLPVFQHAIDWLKKNVNYSPDIIVHLRPTTPIRFKADIAKSIEKFIKNPSADSMRAVCPAPNTPYKMWLQKGEYIEPLLKIPGIDEPYNMPRQKLPQVFWQTGYIDIIRIKTLTELKSMTGKRILPYFIDSNIVVDIDNEYDLKRAEEIIRRTDCIKP